MSQVVTIRRLTDKTPLSATDFKRLVAEDVSLIGGDQGPIIWTDQASGNQRYINVVPESGELETDDFGGEEESICRFLEKLRGVAKALDARLTCEGEDITDPAPVSVSVSKTGCMPVIVSLTLVLALAAFAAVGVV